MSAATAPQPPAKTAQEWKMPKVRLMQPVAWYQGGIRNQQPTGGIIVAIYDRSVAINLLSPDTPYMRCMLGVKHISDPLLREGDRMENGAWDLIEE